MKFTIKTEFTYPIFRIIFLVSILLKTLSLILSYNIQHLLSNILSHSSMISITVILSESFPFNYIY